MNSPYSNYIAWPSQADKDHNTISNSALCEVLSERRIIVTKLFLFHKVASVLL